MIETDTSPPAWRVAAAFVVAPTLAAFLLACYQPLFAGVPDRMDRVLRTTVTFCQFYAYPATLLLGVPIFFFLRSFLRTTVRPTPLNCALAGVVVAVTPWLLLLLLSGAPDHAVAGSRVTAIDGQWTVWGWIGNARFTALIGTAGAVGGAVFWIVAAARLTRRPPKSA